jgi:hypothetical protein
VKNELLHQSTRSAYVHFAEPTKVQSPAGKSDVLKLELVRTLMEYEERTQWPATAQSTPF